MDCMEFFRKAPGQPAKLAVFSGAFHPPTRAHLALAKAALRFADETAFVLPRRFPHKAYESVSLEQRVTLLRRAIEGEPRFSVAVTSGGLFIEIARECRQAYGPDTELWFLCGRDAAERIVNWDYGEPGAFAQMLDEFGLLVADREGPYVAPESMRGRIRRLPVDADYSAVSATRVREAIAAGKPWEHLVPESIHDEVRRLYHG